MVFIVGVTIATLTGDNGILTRAQEAKNKTEQAQKDEENILNSYEDKINEYAGIDWDTVLANAQKHPDQVTSTAIGVGTDGNPVNMDLWIYSLYENGYALNSAEVLSGSIQNMGYSNENIETDQSKENYGKIKGKIPTYISEDNGKNWKPVINMNRTFYHCTNLIIMPEIPITVTDLEGTFMGCTSLQNLQNIPNNVKKMDSTFYNCTSLKNINQLPLNLISMYATFQGCTLLEDICQIPDNVTNMNRTFYRCTTLKKINQLPSNLIDMSETFAYCISLKSICQIPNKVTNMYSTFRYCSSLDNINITIPTNVINIRNLFNGCTHLYGNINILADISIEKEDDGFYAYSSWLNNAATESIEKLVLGPIENKNLIEQIKPQNSNIKCVWE